MDAFHRSIVLNPVSPVLEDPATRVYAAAVFDGAASRRAMGASAGAVTAAIRVELGGPTRRLGMVTGERPVPGSSVPRARKAVAGERNRGYGAHASDACLKDSPRRGRGPATPSA